MYDRLIFTSNQFHVTVALLSAFDVCIVYKHDETVVKKTTTVIHEHKSWRCVFTATQIWTTNLVNGKRSVTLVYRYFKCTLIVLRLKNDLRVEPECLDGLDRPIKSAGYHLNANKFVRPLWPNRTPPRRGVGKVFKLQKLLITFRRRGFDYERYLFFIFMHKHI